MASQAKLLRVLQAGEVERVGSSKSRKIDARVLSATNIDLQRAVNEGRFREDLLFRLNTIEIQLPPLRERRDDVAPLATHFLRRHSARYGKKLDGFDAAAMRMLLDHSWPGNIRELDHAIERAVLLAGGGSIRPADLALKSSGAGPSRIEDLTLEEVEKTLIQKALARFEGNVSQAAKALGLSRSALYRRIAGYGL
jgi:DNA-binding NtrC family response regulator